MQVEILEKHEQGTASGSWSWNHSKWTVRTHCVSDDQSIFAPSIEVRMSNRIQLQMMRGTEERLREWTEQKSV